MTHGKLVTYFKYLNGKAIKFLILYLMTFSLMACAFDSGYKWKDGAYIVIWIDNPNNLTLNYDLGNGGSIKRIGKKVVAVGSNEKYIVVKQYSNGENKSINYYFIDRIKDHKYADMDYAVIGPFSKTDFDMQVRKFNLPDFQVEFK